MSREELIEKMLDTWFDFDRFDMSAAESQQSRMAAALDVAVGELLGDATDQEWARGNWRGPDDQRMDRRCIDANILRSRRSRYLKPKSDPAVEAVEKMFVKDCTGAWCMTASAKEIVAAVRNADKSLA